MQIKGKGEMNTWFLRGIRDQMLQYENVSENSAEKVNENKKETTGKSPYPSQ